MRTHVLLVDDSEMIRNLLMHLLQRSGIAAFEFSEAENGKEGLAVLARVPVDLVLVDRSMPIMDGVEFIRSVRGDARYPDLAIVMVSSEATDEKVREALVAGADSYLVKPPDPATLRRVVGTLIKPAADRREAVDRLAAASGGGTE